MDFFIAINQTLILFIIIIIGYISSKKGVIKETGQQSISSILLSIGIPCLSLSSANFEYSKEVLPNIITIAAVTTISYILIILMTSVIAKAMKLSDTISSVFTALIVFGNVGFMGFPVAYAFFAEKGVFYASIVNLVFSLFLWSFGILLFNKQDKIDFKRLLNNGTISAVLTVLLFLFQIKLPVVVQTVLDLTGKMTVPLSCILIGAMISNVHLNKLFKDSKVFIVSFIKLLFIPIASAIILKLFGFNDMVISISVLMSAMPSATAIAIFAKQFDYETEFATICVFMTTFISIISLPAIIFILSNFIL